VSGYQPDAYDHQRFNEAQVIGAKCPGWYVTYGAYSRWFWAFGAPDGRPIGAQSASELLGRMRAAERSRSEPYYELILVEGDLLPIRLRWSRPAEVAQ
jgi:hypothetical protein